MITKAFGMQIDFKSGSMRNWIVGDDGVKRWADTHEPIDIVKNETFSNDCVNRDSVA